MEKMVAQPCSTDLKMTLFSSGSRKLPAYSSSIVSHPVCSIRSARAVEGSDEFPFELITRSGYGLKIKETYLQRELDDEVIRVSAEYETDEDEDEDEEDDDDEDEVEEDDDDDEFDDEVEEDDEEDEEDSGIAMKVNIFQKKSTGKQLKLDVTSFPDEIRVDHFSIKKPEQYYLDVTKTGGKY
ncbi:hypothetical protein ACLB2K_064008 [Fragaria x ananassa]